LKEADHLLERPPSEGSAEHARLMTLLREIASYRPDIYSAAEGSVSAERARLARHLTDFEERVMPHYGPHWATLIGGDFSRK
jgi:hypothetical protein